MTTTPHFTLPFRVGDSDFCTVEQDEYIDIFNCISAIVRTPFGTRNEVPEFGRPTVLFVNQPVGKEFLTSAIMTQEPRAEIVVTEVPDRYDELIDNIRIDVYQSGDDQ